MTTTLLLFAYVQLLDLLTTLVGFRLGASEMSPFIRMLIAWFGPVGGLLATKLVAVGLVGACYTLGRRGAVMKINYFFAALVLWNLAMILRGVTG